MQKNDLGLKRKILIDGEEIPGLVEMSALKDEEGVIEVPSFGRKIPIKDGVKKFEPIDCTYKVARDTITQKFFYDWFTKNEYHDVTIVNTDVTGEPVDKWLLRDCECSGYDNRAYNAGAVEFFGIMVKLVCTSTPVRVNP